MPPPLSLPSVPSSGLWTCRLPPPHWRVETWAPDTPGSPAVPRSRAPSGSGICSTWSLPASPPSSPPASSLGLPSPPRSPVLPLAPECALGGMGGRGRPLFSQGRWDGGGALSFLLFIALGLWGGFPWPPPLPQGRGRSPGESQAWGGSPRVRRGGGRSPVTEVPGPGPSPKCQTRPIAGHLSSCPGCPDRCLPWCWGQSGTQGTGRSYSGGSAKSELGWEMGTVR